MVLQPKNNCIDLKIGTNPFN